MDEPKHGEIRNYHYETQPVGEAHELLDGVTQEVVYRGPLSWAGQTVSERWCSHCKKWIRCEGVMGPLRFLAFHDKNDCANDKKPLALEML